MVYDDRRPAAYSIFLHQPSCRSPIWKSDLSRPSGLVDALALECREDFAGLIVVHTTDSTPGRTTQSPTSIAYCRGCPAERGEARAAGSRAGIEAGPMRRSSAGSSGIWSTDGGAPAAAGARPTASARNARPTRLGCGQLSVHNRGVGALISVCCAGGARNLRPSGGGWGVL